MDERWISAEQEVLSDGINSAFRPDQIGANQAAWASNLTIRDGKPQSRDFNLIQRATLPKGIVQGVQFFSVDGGMFVLGIWGQLWRILLAGDNVEIDAIPLGFVNSPILPQVWMCETAGSFVIQDGQSDAVIYDGASTRRSDPTINEVPLGRQMVYGNGRLAVAVEGNQVEAGNITDQVFQSELFFVENTYLSGGGAFLFTYDVKALASLPVNNTDTGYGSCIVLGARYANSLSLQITARETWDQIPGFEQVVLPQIGAAGQDAMVAVNQDLYWRDTKGQIWSLRAAQWDQLSPGNSPLNREVRRITDHESPLLLPFTGGIFFENRIFFLASPFFNRFGCASFKCLLSLDCAPLATIRGKSPPAYDGVVEGLNFVRLFTGTPDGEDRAFLISTDDGGDGENRLWEIVTNQYQDASFLSNGTANTLLLTPNPVSTYFESRRFNFDLPKRLKRLMRVDLWPAELRGQVSVTVYWRADNRSQWTAIDTISMDAQMTNNPGQWVDLEAQERGRVMSFTLPDAVDDQDLQPRYVGFGFQVRIAWTGYMLLDRIALWSLPLPESAYSNIPVLVTVPSQNVVTNNSLGYLIPTGGLGGSYTDQNGNPYADSFKIVYTEAPISV